ncbi:hypothetical protein [Oceaniglobus ichthyenteri]|uniref:hypothetical protein n=1 Tax=Oceaniglobus ichthyenteri TaxID=2136177 RepID=UPI000D3340F0|nr:hypothetical protein [Oceaniglobus ichthyenteri]
MNPENLTRLAQLAAMKRDVDLQDVSRITGQMNALQREIDALRDEVKARDEDLTLDPARMTGVDVVWRRWVDQTVRHHQARMAELAMAREMFMGKARTSFGRADVLDKLNNQQKKPRSD